MKALTRKKRRLLARRRLFNSWTLDTLAHRRSILRGEGKGLRCLECQDIPLLPWEVEMNRRHVERYGDDWPTGVPGQ